MDTTTNFKRVPAVDKCFGVLDLLARSGGALSISEISSTMSYNKSTVFNLLYTLTDLKVLEKGPDNRFRLGTRLYALGKSAGKGSDIIRVVHPYLEEINRKTKLSAFLGIRSGLQAIIVDKADSAYDIKISPEVGMKVPLLAGAGGKALLSMFSDLEIEQILDENGLRQFTRFTCMDREEFREMIQKVREEGIAFDWEEYIPGICALSVPLKIQKKYLQAALWAVGLRHQFTSDAIGTHVSLLKTVARNIERKIFPG